MTSIEQPTTTDPTTPTRRTWQTPELLQLPTDATAGSFGNPSDGGGASS